MRLAKGTETGATPQPLPRGLGDQRDLVRPDRGLTCVAVLPRT